MIRRRIAVPAPSARPRRRLASIFGVLALVAISVFGGALPAHAETPHDLTITSPAAGFTSANSVTVAGTFADVDNGTWQVRIFNNDVDVCTTVVQYFNYGTGGNPPDTADFFCNELNLTYGDNVLRYDIEGDSGLAASSGSITVTRFGTDPALFDSNPYYTSEVFPEFGGTGPQIGSVFVERGDGTPLCSATLGVTTGWACTSTVAFDPGDSQPIQVRTVLADGTDLGVTDSSSVNIIAPATPVLNDPDTSVMGTGPFYTGYELLQMEGYLAPTEYVDSPVLQVWVQSNGAPEVPYCSVDDVDGDWACADFQGTLAIGTNVLFARATSQGGLDSPISNTITIIRLASPVITSPANGTVTSDPNVTFTATFDDWAIVDDFEIRGTGTSNPLYCEGTATSATLSCTVDSPLGDGETEYYISVGPGIGLTSAPQTITIDTVPPLAPSITAPGTIGPSGMLEVTSPTAPVLSGIGENGATVEVLQNGLPVTCANTLVSDSAWTCSFTGPTIPGIYVYQASQQDAAGNESGLSPTAGSLQLTIPPVIVSPGDGDGLPNPFTFTGLGPPLGTIELYDDLTPGDSLICSTTVASDGTWSCALPTPLSYGSHDIFARATTVSSAFAGDSIPINLVAQPDPPSSTTSADPAGLTTLGEGDPDGGVHIGFYSVDPNPTGYIYNFITGCPDGPASNIESCSIDSLLPGMYVSSTYQSVDSINSGLSNDFILIPDVPGLTAHLNADRTVTLSGTGVPGYLVLVTDDDGVAACGATVDGSGNWSCSVAPAAGAVAYRAQQQTVGFTPQYSATNVRYPSGVVQGLSAFTSFVNLVIPAAPIPAPVPLVTPTPGPTATPTPTPSPIPPLVWKLQGLAEFYEPGDPYDLWAEGLPAGSVVQGEIHSTPMPLGATSVGADGKFTLSGTIPLTIEPGKHTIVVTVTPPGQAASPVEEAVTVNPIVTTKFAAAATDHDGFQREDAGGGRNDPAGPSSLTYSIRTTSDLTPLLVGLAGLASLALLLLVAFPAELLNSTISENYSRFARVIPAIKAPWWQRLTAWLTARPLFGALLVMLVASVIFGFADPGFGFDIVSVRVVLACFLALLVVGYLASIITGAIVRGRWNLATTMEIKPLGLILTIVGVVLSRLLDFSPGFLIGLLVGLALVGSTTVAERAKATLVGAGVVFALALIGWIVYSVLIATTTPDSFGTALLFDTMVAVTTEGLTALFIGLLPFRYLDGESVFAHSKVLWVASYIVAAIAFVLIVVPTAWGEPSGSLWTWTIVLGAFAIVALGVYLYFRFLAPPLKEEDEEKTKELVDL